MSQTDHTMGQASVRRVLVAKTSSPQYLRLALERVHFSFPTAELAIWTEERHSEEYFGRTDVSQVFLYRSMRTLRALARELATFDADVIVTQRTFEADYEKMHALALILFRGPGIVVDELGDIQVDGSWRRRVRSVVGATVFRLSNGKSGQLTAGALVPILSIGFVVALLRFIGRGGIWLGRIAAAPFVLLYLLAEAARLELGRRHSPDPPGASHS